MSNENKKIAIVGAGFSGAIIARELAETGYSCTVYDTRNHAAGNCHTKRENNGVMVHVYGPHIFHTDNERAWNYINTYGEMMPYNHRVFTTVNGIVYAMPINLHTINQLFDTQMNPEEATNFIKNLAEKIEKPKNFEEQAISMVGTKIYETFLKGYTKKQWGINPTELPAEILKRLPLRFNYQDSYFNHQWQAIPKNGYTQIVENILNHKNITLKLNTTFNPDNSKNYNHTIWTGPLDAWFNYEHGKLGYRTLDFERSEYNGDKQGCPVMNYGNESIPYTRITEHKHFAPWENTKHSVLYTEYSRLAEEGDIPYYPIRLTNDKELLNKYIEAAEQEQNVSFVGRLATYRYIDMDVTIKEALEAADTLTETLNNKKTPSFFIDPR